MSHLVSYWWIRKTQVIPEYVVFYKKVGGFTWRVSGCEELVGGLLTGDDGVGFRVCYYFVPDELYLTRKMSLSPKCVFPSNSPLVEPVT